jgi:hypothetical protein
LLEKSLFNASYFLEALFLGPQITLTLHDGVGNSMGSESVIVLGMAMITRIYANLAEMDSWPSGWSILQGVASVLLYVDYVYVFWTQKRKTRKSSQKNE